MIEGEGGGDDLGERNIGLLVWETGSVVSLGSGTDAATLTLKGTGGSGTFDNHGIEIRGLVQSVDGAVLIEGKGGSGTDEAISGIRLLDSGLVRSTGLGDNAATLTLRAREVPLQRKTRESF